MEEIYQRVTQLFADKVNAVFESEETLKAQFEALFPRLEFNRTDHWCGILYKVFRDCWLEAGPEVKGESTGFDRNAVLKRLIPLLDYNLFTQVLLNLQSYTTFAYQALDAEKDLAAIGEKWKDRKRTPTDPKAKMVRTATVSEEDGEFNDDLSTVKSLRIIASFTPQISFRVSPKGSTPALVDANNISSLGVGSDKYLRTFPGLKAFYIHWIPETGPLMASVPVDASDRTAMRAEGISYPFYSKSGGEILNQVLFSRKVAYELFRAFDIENETITILPRLSSVLAVTEEKGTKLREVFAGLKLRYPMLEFAEGVR